MLIIVAFFRELIGSGKLFGMTILKLFKMVVGIKQMVYSYLHQVHSLSSDLLSGD